MKKKIILVLILSLLFILGGCKSRNNIINTSYNVDIDITNINEAFIPASKKASEAVLGVNCYIKKNLYGSYALASTGSGCVYKGYAILDNNEKIEISESIDKDNISKYEYYMITNCHVITDSNNSTKVKVYIQDINQLIDATVLGKNGYDDIAVLKFTSTYFIMPLSFATDEVETGEIVLAIGNPLGYEYSSSVTMGIVSYAKRYLDVKRDANFDGVKEWNGTVELIQHDACINSGNSGGALVNIKGELVGMNVLKITNDEDSVEGMSFAIPAYIIQKYLPKLENGENIKESLTYSTYSINDLKNQMFLSDIPNIDIPSGYDYEYGIFVYSIKKNNLNIKANDIIMEINGTKIYSNKNFNCIMHYYGDSIDSIKIFRSGQIIDI